MKLHQLTYIKMLNFLQLAIISTMMLTTTGEELICHSELTDAASTWKVLFKESRADAISPNEQMITVLLFISWLAMVLCNLN